MKLPLPQNAVSMCFGCSPHNPIGLKLTFTLQEGVCRCQFTAREEHQGWPGYMHGGLIATLLDETMANWLKFHNLNTMTAEMTVRYMKAVPIHTPLLIEARNLEHKGRLVVMEGRIFLPDGQCTSRATAKFLQVDFQPV
ncbi:PaaI family thioesterase [Desulfurispora thermophila]|uniref:PaaI family thioesterase n=1 Tax=Desulfurispora thermophila TaxID=265470 RepID=UPI00036DBC2A|nr:PaaI family thioesterase [Desulfurispora thermophila]